MFTHTRKNHFPKKDLNIYVKKLTWFLVGAVFDFDGLYDGGGDIGLHAGEVLVYGPGL